VIIVDGTALRLRLESATLEVNMSGFDLTRRPSPGDCSEYLAGYVAAAPDGDILTTLEREGARAVPLFRALTAEQADFAYAPGKWSVREVVAHLSDSERVFAYRALRFGRADETPLPSFDQDAWLPYAHARERPWNELVDELAAVRATSLHLFRSFAPEDWERRGVASGHPIQVRAIAWVIAGHEIHHRRVLAERYGIAVPPVG